MIIEKQIEDAIIAKLKALDLPGVRVTGAWKSVADGEVKGEGDTSSAVLAVAVNPRSYDGFMSEQADFSCAVALVVRRESCPTGSAVAEFTEALFQLFETWNRDADAVYTDLETDGFQPAGLQLSGGEGPWYDEATCTWMVEQSFTLRGFVK